MRPVALVMTPEFQGAKEGKRELLAQPTEMNYFRKHQQALSATWNLIPALIKLGENEREKEG